MKPIEPITPQGLGFFPVLNLPWKPVSGKNPEPDLNHLGKLPGSKTAESPSVPASEPDRTQWLQWFDSFDLPYFTHGFRWRWMVLDGPGWSSPDMGSHRLFSTEPDHPMGRSIPSQAAISWLVKRPRKNSHPTPPWIYMEFRIPNDWNQTFRVEAELKPMGAARFCCPTHLEVASEFFLLEQLIRLGPRTGAACAHTGKRSRQSELGQGKIVAIWRSTGWIWMDIRIHLYNLCIYGYPLVSFTLCYGKSPF